MHIKPRPAIEKTKLYSLAEVADILLMSKSEVHRLTKTGQLPYIKFGEGRCVKRFMGISLLNFCFKHMVKGPASIRHTNISELPPEEDTPPERDSPAAVPPQPGNRAITTRSQRGRTLVGARGSGGKARAYPGG